MKRNFFILAVLSLAFSFLVTGCDNFQNGSDLREQIKLAVYNAKYKPNLVVMLGEINDSNYGTIEPYRDSEEFHEYKFNVYDEYEFKNWMVLELIENDYYITSCSKTTDPVYIPDTETTMLKYRLNMSSAKKSFAIFPCCLKRPVVKRCSPVFPDDGLKSYPTIYIEFEDDIIVENIEDHIEIFTKDGENSDQVIDLKQHFSAAQISADKKSITINPKLDENKLPLNEGELKTITVRLSDIKREGLILNNFPATSEMLNDLVWTYVVKG